MKPHSIRSVICFVALIACCLSQQPILAADVTAQTVQAGNSGRGSPAIDPTTGKPFPVVDPDDLRISGRMILQRKDSGEVKFNAESCQQEDVYRVVAALAKKNIRIESLPNAPITVHYDTYSKADFLFREIVLNSMFIDVTKEGDVYVIRKSKASEAIESKASEIIKRGLGPR